MNTTGFGQDTASLEDGCPIVEAMYTAPPKNGCPVAEAVCGTSMREKHPIARPVYALICILLLGMNFASANDNYFVTLSMFMVPMVFDYRSIGSTMNLRNAVQIVHHIYVLFLLVFCALGLTGVLHIVVDATTPYVVISKDYAAFAGARWPLVWIWRSTFLSFIYGVIDNVLAYWGPDGKPRRKRGEEAETESDRTDVPEAPEDQDVPEDQEVQEDQEVGEDRETQEIYVGQ